MNTIAERPSDTYIEVRYGLKFGYWNLGAKIAAAQATAKTETIASIVSVDLGRNRIHSR